MKSVLAVGVLAFIAWPSVAAAEAVAPCQADDARAAHASTERVEPTAAAAPSISARQAAAQRETAETRADATRRRSGKRVPDAELIGPRGAL